ncbi:MAG: DUF3800 domain-containing protein [Reyranella sp.]|jgi:hypothetical protein|nr:DUF3800 domain-containing protein [Reyranella sp.]
MSDAYSLPYTQRHYFVDEAEDSTIFGSRGRVLVGTAGCSTFFMLGALQVEDPAALTVELDALRGICAADERLQIIPSFKKTQQAFHAKDDADVVRARVFEVLARHDLRFFAVIADKRAHLNFIREQNERGTIYRYGANSLYDSMVPRLFRDRLHKADVIAVRFAKRGHRDRTTALQRAIDKARRRFERKWQKENDATIFVEAADPHRHAGLQAADYFLWALQRMYERGQDRYWELVRHRASLIVDADDRADRGYGEHYGKGGPVLSTLLTRKRVPGI